MTNLFKQYEKVCYTCNYCACNRHDETEDNAEFWCEKDIVGFQSMDLIETKNRVCKNWKIFKGEDFENTKV